MILAGAMGLIILIVLLILIDWRSTIMMKSKIVNGKSPQVSHALRSRVATGWESRNEQGVDLVSGKALFGGVRAENTGKNRG